MKGGEYEIYLYPTLAQKRSISLIYILHPQGFCADIDAKIASMSDAYISFLTEHVYATLQYYLWGDPHNTEITRLLYAKRTPIPSNLYYPSTYIQTTKQLMKTLEIFSIYNNLDNHQTNSVSREHIRKFLSTSSIT